MVNILEVKQVCFSYAHGEPVLRELCFSVEKGRRVAVLGSNGAGKSTLFSLLNGLLEPESGEILYEGQCMRGKQGLRFLRRQVGYVFQEADHQLVAPTVEAEISFGPMNLGLPGQEVKERVDEAVSYMDLAACRDRAPHYLSGGQKKRVGIADILAMRPEVILLDEPAASLDPVNEEALETVMEQLSAQGRTLLVSTHDVDFAYRFADRILVLEAGRVLAEGSPEEIFGQEEMLRRAGLKKPLLWEVCRILQQSGRLPEKFSAQGCSGIGKKVWPKRIEEFAGTFL